MKARVVDGLNRLLADGTVLYQKLRHYHWNVHGPHFIELHARFEALYTGWETTIDELAERVRSIGAAPLPTLKAVLQVTTLEEDPGTPEGREMVARIVADLRAIHGAAGEVIELAEEAGDRGTVNLLDGIRDGIEQELWMLEAWMEQAPAWRGV